MKTLVVSADHGGVTLRQSVHEAARACGWTILDVGPPEGVRVDYPDYAQKGVEHVLTGAAQLAVLLCGSGIGMAITANKFSGVRAAVVSDAYSARMSRAHNDANVLCLGGRVVGPGVAYDCVQAFLTAAFEGERHTGRLQKITEIEQAAHERLSSHTTRPTP